MQEKPVDEHIMKSRIADKFIDGQCFPSRFIEEQTRRSCRVRFEDESVGTTGGKGEELKTQDSWTGSGVGGDKHVGGTGSSEETEEALTSRHGVDGVFSVLIDVWERRSFENHSFERIDQRHTEDNDETTARQQFKQSLTDKRRLLAAPALASTVRPCTSRVRPCKTV